MEAMTEVGTGDDRLVVASAAAGDELAFARIVAAHHAEMVRICHMIARDRGVAEEAVQATWSIAWRKLGTVRQRERLRPWLISVAVNETRKLLKARTRRLRIEVIGEPPERAGGVDPATGIASLDLEDALARLEPQDRALLALRYVAGFDASELASALGLTPSGTRTRLERLLKRLREDLDHA
jgi:RNA polymerase sigma-70 factor (ECF subfamily)